MPPTTGLRLKDLPGSARLAIGAFALFVLGLHLAAQATLWVTAGGGSLPGPDEVLAKYHGRKDRTRLHEVFDLSRPQGDPKAMYWYLDANSAPDRLDLVRERRQTVLEWAEAGAPESGWGSVRKVLHQEAMCLQCHGFGGEKHHDLPLEDYAQVRAVAQPGAGIGLGALLTSAHNHLFAFGALALLLALATAFTSAAPLVRTLLATGAFGGAALDVVGWFLTRAYGDPFPWVVIAGGAAFGACTGLMAALVLDEVLFGGRFTARLRLAGRPTG